MNLDLQLCFSLFFKRSTICRGNYCAVRAPNGKSENSVMIDWFIEDDSVVVENVDGFNVEFVGKLGDEEVAVG
jgi:hypothetical protein